MTLDLSIRHRYPAFSLEVAFSAPQGLTALFGRSGSGKTSIVNVVAGLLRPDSGRVSIGGRVLSDSDAGIWVPPHRRRVGYVFQEGRLFPHLTVAQNIRYGRWFAPGARSGAEVDHVVDLLGIGSIMSRRPGALSGGEKQRVAIGRALLSKPDLLLMDEPLAALDEARKQEILPYIERLRDDTRVPILYVSHSMAEVTRLATYVVALEEGRVVRSGSAEDVLSDPDAVPALGVTEAGSVLTGTVHSHHDDGLTEIAVSSGRLLLPRIGAPPGTHLRIRVEARDVMLSTERPRGLSALNILPGTVSAVRRGTGPGVVVQLRSGDDLLLARITRRSAEAMQIAPGTQCFAIMKSVAVAKANVGLIGDRDWVGED